MNNPEYISNLMANVTKDVLFKSYKNMFVKNYYNKDYNKVLDLVSVSSSKKEAYFLENACGRGVHKIFFGSKVLEEELKSNRVAYWWRTGEEIFNMGYCGGILTPQNIIIHTILHEYAHLMDYYRNGTRKNEKHHNKFFYKELDNLYNNKDDKLLFNELNSDKVFRELSFVQEERLFKKDDFKIGDIISWIQDISSKDVRREFEVVRVNRTSVTVQCLNSFSGKFRVFYPFIVSKGEVFG